MPITIYVRRCTVANQMFRYMLAMKLVELIPDSVATGYYMPEWNLVSACSDVPRWKNPAKLGPVHQIDLKGLEYGIKEGVFDGVDVGCYGQRLEYFRDGLERFRRLFHSEVSGFQTTRRELVVNIRTGEIINGLHQDYVPVSIAYYQQLVDETGLDPVFVGQVDGNFYTDALRASFPRARYLKGSSWMEDFQTIRHARNIVVAVSTFSWLAAWLSRARRIFLPVSGLFNPHQREDVNLIPLNDERYVMYQFPTVRYVGSEEQKRNLIKPWNSVDSYPLVSHDKLAGIIFPQWK